VLFLDTGKHFPETLAYRDELVARLGLTNLINLTPDPAPAGQERRKRPALVLRSRWLLRDSQGPAPGPRAGPVRRQLYGAQGLSKRDPRWPSPVRAGPDRPCRAAEGQSAGRLVQRPDPVLFRRNRPAPAPAGRAGLPLDRLHALHQQGRAGRRPPLGPLEGLGQDRMRHSRRWRGQRTAARLRSRFLKQVLQEQADQPGLAGHPRLGIDLA